MSGQFDPFTAVCEIFVDRSTVRSPAANAGDAEMFAVLAAINAQVGTDTVEIESQPIIADPSVMGTAFHEQYHYLQLLSSPVLQRGFTAGLDKLRRVVGANGGRADSVAGIGDGQPLTAITAMLGRTLALYDVTSTEFEPWKDFRGSYDEYTTATLGHLRSGYADEWHPTYFIELGFKNAESHVFLITLRHLVESAAFVAQRLFERKAIPRLEPQHPPELDHYLGLWELWARANAGNYNSQRDLAIAFLAVVDVALLGSSVDDSAQSLENGFPALRFGKLLARSRVTKPLLAGVASVADIAAFQSELIERCKFERAVDARIAAVQYLARVLLESLSSLLSEEGRRLAAAIATGAPTLTLAQVLREVAEPFRTDQRLPVGAHVLGAMVNALAFTIDQPGAFAALSENPQYVLPRFSLPLIMVDGKYHALGTSDGMRTISAIPVWDGMLRSDLISLMVLRPLLTAKPSCGFIEARTNCCYMVKGLGCPYDGESSITAQQIEIRARTGLKNWCHKTWVDWHTDLMGQESRDYWEAQAAERGGRQNSHVTMIRSI